MQMSTFGKEKNGDNSILVGKGLKMQNSQKNENIRKSPILDIAPYTSIWDSLQSHLISCRYVANVHNLCVLHVKYNPLLTFYRYHVTQIQLPYHCSFNIYWYLVRVDKFH